MSESVQKSARQIQEQIMFEKDKMIEKLSTPKETPRILQEKLKFEQTIVSATNFQASSPLETS